MESKTDLCGQAYLGKTDVRLSIPIQGRTEEVRDGAKYRQKVRAHGQSIGDQNNLGFLKSNTGSKRKY